MDREKTQEFATRITQANQSSLVVIIFDIILECIESCICSIEKSDTSEYEKDLKRARKCLNELMAGLDYHNKVSFELIPLYTFVDKLLVEAKWKNQIENLNASKSILSKLLVGFEKVSEADHSRPLMGNTQQIYAGLTYGRDSLNESSYSTDEINRGFRA